MCLAVPGKIIRIKGDDAIVDYGIEKREAKLISDEFQVGDYVIVQAKTVMMKVPKKQAEESLKLIKNGC